MSLYETPGERRTGNRPHKDPQFEAVGSITGDDDESEMVNCAVCGAVAMGHTPDGSPLYTGGTILARLLRENDLPPTEVVFACRCRVGIAFHDSRAMAYFDEAPPLVEFPFAALPLRMPDGGVLHATIWNLINEPSVWRHYLPHVPEPQLRQINARRNPTDYNERALKGASDD